MQLIRSMAPVTASPPSEPRPLALHWSGRLSLAWRILLVNIVPVALLASSLFYLDSIRNRLLEERVSQAISEAQLVSRWLATTPPAVRANALQELGKATGVRYRLFQNGTQISDSWNGQQHTIQLTDPRTDRWDRALAAALDDMIDTLVSASEVKSFKGFGNIPKNDAELYLAEDRTHIVTAKAAISGPHPAILVTDRNDRDVRRLVRAERSRFGMMIGLTLLFSVLLSRFLARTIAKPLGALALAAERVRLGREREIIIPRLSRSDEIGALSRALADMTDNLRERIDATEAFAADVAHELKNPLASLSSALETMQTIKDKSLKKQLMDIALADVQRLDRLISDIAEASRLDAQLSRTHFQAIDLGHLLGRLLKDREARGVNKGISLAFARPQKGSACVLGDPGRLLRAIENLIDNAVSFSPSQGVVRIAATRSGDAIVISVEDEGPGVPINQRDAVFERFHSDRPDIEAFGRHSGLGLSIARTIVEAHDGTIAARDRPNGAKGAMFVITLPATNQRPK